MFDLLSGFRRLMFRWEERNFEWLLLPSSIRVAERDGFWLVFVGDRPLVLRYSSANGAKVDAWKFALSKSVALFGTRRISLSQD